MDCAFPSATRTLLGRARFAASIYWKLQISNTEAENFEFLSKISSIWLLEVEENLASTKFSHVGV